MNIYLLNMQNKELVLTEARETIDSVFSVIKKEDIKTTFNYYDDLECIEEGTEYEHWIGIIKRSVVLFIENTNIEFYVYYSFTAHEECKGRYYIAWCTNIEAEWLEIKKDDSVLPNHYNYKIIIRDEFGVEYTKEELYELLLKYTNLNNLNCPELKKMVTECIEDIKDI